MAATTVPVGSLPDVPTSADAGEPQVDDETQPVAVPPPKLGLKLEDEPFWSTKRWLNKGNVSNMVTFSIMIVFIILKMNDDANLAIDYGLAFGLFGFAGGVTNWLAVTMLFDKVPLLIGSGVIPRHFKAISRASTEKFIDMFFEEERLRSYIAANQSGLMTAIDIPRMIRETVQSPDFDATLTKALTDVSTKPEGAMLMMIAPMMGGIEGMVPQLKPMLVSFAVTMSEKVAGADISKKIPVDKVRGIVENFLEEGLSQLTPQAVKLMMEKVIREHLGWLVVWGNVFGGAIGVVCLAAGLQLGQPTCPASV